PVVAPVVSASTAHVGTRSPSVSSRLEVAFGGTKTGVVHDFFRQTDGFVARCELDATLFDRAGSVVLAGHVSGIAYDDASDPDELKAEKRADIVESAQRDAASKLGHALRNAADERSKDA